jgi:hypothetical protein
VQGVNNITGGLQKVGQRGNVVFTGMAKQQKEAREAGMLLSNTLGVQIPAGLEKILAKMPGVSGALATAFKGAVLIAFIAGLVQVVTHLDEFKRKAQEAGYSIALALDQTIGLYDGALVAGERAIQQQKDMKPVLDAVTAAQKAAATAGKEGYGALSAALKQSQQDADTLASTMKATALERAVSDEDYAQRVTLIDGQVKAIKIANAQAAAREIGKLARQQLDDAKKAADDLTLINLEGSGKIIQQRQIELDQIKKMENEGKVSHTAAEQQRVNASFKAAQDIYHLYEEYARATYALQQQSALAGVEGIAKIELDAQQKRINAQIDFDRQFGSLAANDSTRINAEKRLQERLTAIDQDGTDQRKKLVEQYSEETAQLIERAATAALPEWARATSQIANDNADAMRKIQSDVQHTVITEEEGQKRRAAVWQETNAKLVDEHKKVVETMAGQLESLFSGSITQNIINLLKKFLFKMLAEWLTHFSALQNGFGGLFSKLFNGGGGGGGGFGLGSLLGLGGSSGGGSVAGAGSGVNQSFIGSLGLTGPSNSGSGFSLAGLGGLAVGGAMLGVGAVFSSALSSILTPEPSKAMIAAQVLQADQANASSLQQVLQDYRDDKIDYATARRKIGVAGEMAHSKELYFNPSSLSSIDSSFKALMDQLNEIQFTKARALNPGFGHGAATFHDGGEVPAVLEVGEHVIKKAAARRHRGTLNAINDGTYQGGGGDHYHFHTLDAMTVDHWLRNGGAEKIANGVGRFKNEGGAA